MARQIFRRLSLLVFLSSVAPITGSGAQEALLRQLENRPFHEVLLQAPPSPLRSGTGGTTAGVTVTGVHASAIDAPVDLGNLKVQLGEHATQRNRVLCFRIISRDGRYSANVGFQMAPSTGLARLDLKSRYAEALKSYRQSDLAVLAQLAEDCAAPRDVTYIVSTFGASPASEIVVRLAGPPVRVHAQLGKDKQAFSPVVLCEASAHSVQIGFTQECRLPLAPDLAPGIYQLGLGETAIDGKIVVKRSPIILVGQRAHPARPAAGIP